MTHLKGRNEELVTNDGEGDEHVKDAGDVQHERPAGFGDGKVAVRAVGEMSLDLRLQGRAGQVGGSRKDRERGRG